MAMKIFVKRVFTIFATNASFLRVISNFRIWLSKICNIYDVIVHFLPKKHCFYPKRHFLCPKISKKSAEIATNLNSRQNSVCLGLKFLSESKLFGGCHPCSRATSATLSSVFRPVVRSGNALQYQVLRPSHLWTQASLSIEINWWPTFAGWLSQKLMRWEVARLTKLCQMWQS